MTIDLLTTDFICFTLLVYSIGIATGIFLGYYAKKE